MRVWGRVGNTQVGHFPRVKGSGCGGPMLEEIKIACFATSYAVALVLEISRPAFRSGVRGVVMLGFAGVGLVAHTAYLYHRAIRSPGSPLSSEQDWYLIAAWVLVSAYLLLVYYHPRTGFGLFLLPLVLGLIGVAWFFADQEPFARGPASRVWGGIHGSSLLLAVVAVLIGFAAGLMYLEQARRLKHKLPPIRGLRLPSLEWLERTNSRAIVVSLLMLGLGVLSGVVLNRIGKEDMDRGLPWYDPVVLGASGMFVWLLIATIGGGLYRPARKGRKVAYMTVVSFVFLAIALSMGLFFDTLHGGKRGKENVQGNDEARMTNDEVKGAESELRHSSFELRHSYCPLPTTHYPLLPPHLPSARGGRV